MLWLLILRFCIRVLYQLGLLLAEELCAVGKTASDPLSLSLDCVLSYVAIKRHGQGRDVIF